MAINLSPPGTLTTPAPEAEVLVAELDAVPEEEEALPVEEVPVELVELTPETVPSTLPRPSVPAALRADEQADAVLDEPARVAEPSKEQALSEEPCWR